MSTWLLVRGLTRECRHWGDFALRLRRRLPAAAIEAVELPGNGSLHRLTGCARAVALAEHCRNALAARGVPPPFRPIGLSLGGMVALAWAHAWPQDIDGCVLINCSLGGLSPWHRRLRPRALAKLLASCRPGVAEEAREGAILELTSRLAPDRGSVLAEWTAWRRECPVSPANALRQLAAAIRFHCPASPPPCDLLVLAGLGDRLVDPDCSWRIAHRWACSYAAHPDAGHDLPLDDGDWVAAQIACWQEARSRFGWSARAGEGALPL